MSNRNNLSPLEKATIGAFASVVANTVVYPLDITKTLIQSQQNLKHFTKEQIESDPNLYKNTIDCLKKLYKKHGIQGWYYGIIPSLSTTATMNFSYFFWYAVVHKFYDKRFPNKAKSTAVELALGAIAGAMCNLIFMPIATISTKQQTEIAGEDSQETNQKAKNPSFFETAVKIYKSDGLPGLWSGLKVSLVLTSNPSITYGAFERLRETFFAGKSNLSALEAFSLGVFSKLLATVVTHPLIVSKVMIQKKSTTVTEKVTDPVTGEDKLVKTKRNFKTFQECLVYLYKSNGLFGLWKGVLPQISKAVVVQGFLFMFKEQLEVLFISLLRSLKKKRALA